jgi:hypothetical protein
MHTQKYVTLRGDFSIGRMRKGYGNFCGSKNKSGSESDDNDDSTPSGKAIRDASKQVKNFSMQ